MIEECETCTKQESYQKSFGSKPLDVVIAGVQKAGSTSMLHYLRQHPEIIGHEKIEFDYMVRDQFYEQGYDEAFRRHFGSVGRGKVLLGKAVATTYIQEVVRRLYYHNPSCKIIVLLRNPIDRAYSAYWYARKLGWETKTSFEEALDAEAKRREEANEVIRHCSYVERGKYDEQIETLYQFFGKENVHVQIFEQFVDAPDRGCNKVCQFLGIEPYKFEPSQKHNSREVPRSQSLAVFTRFLRQNPVSRAIRRSLSSGFRSKFGDVIRWIDATNRVKEKNTSMKRETRQKLAKIFQPHVERTEDLTGHSLDHWM